MLGGIVYCSRSVCVCVCVQPITEYRAYESGRESPTQWDAEPLQPHRRPRSPSPNPITQVRTLAVCKLQLHFAIKQRK